MIIQRLSKGIKEQDWFVVTVEVLIVVVGIFIGLQVDDWNEGRKDKLKANEYQVRLLNDLQADLKSSQNAMEYYAQIMQHNENVLLALEVGVNDPNEELLISFVMASSVVYHASARDTYDELIASGAINLIANLDVRSQVVNYYNTMETSARYREEQPDFRRIMQTYIPARMRDQIFVVCEEASPTGSFIYVENCQANFSSEEISRAWDLLFNSDDLSREKLWQEANRQLENSLTDYRTIQEDNNHVRGLIQLLEVHE